MAYIDLWGAYAHACGRFGIYPGQNQKVFSFQRPGQPTGSVSPTPSGPTRSPSLTAEFLKTCGNADGLGWFAELGQQIIKDIARRNGLDLTRTTRVPDPTFDFENHFKSLRRIRPL